MKRELLLLRHGKSDWSHPVADFDRPLKKRGKRAAARMGNWLRQQKKIPELVVASPARRALATARIVAGELGIPEARISVDPEIYDAHWRGLLALVRGLPRDKKRVMLVGHNTSMEELLLYLAAGRARPGANGKLFPTAALALFACKAGWKVLGPKQVGAVTVVRPRELAAK